MKTMLLGLATLTIALIPTSPVTAAGAGPAPTTGAGAHDPHRHGWYVHYHHRGHYHVAGPFHHRHDADDHAEYLRHRGYHVERIVRN